MDAERLSIEDRLVRRYADRLDCVITSWMSRTGISVLRIGLGIVFLWFGSLKFVPGLSPAEELVRQTVFFLPSQVFLPVLATWEVLIGFGLITGRFVRATLLLLFLQMPGTALPLLVLPEVVWSRFPLGLTLEGQYIIKNLVLVGGGLVLGSTVRGCFRSGNAKSDPGPSSAQG